MFQAVTGKLLAFRTVFCLAFMEKFAIFDFTSGTGDRYIQVRFSAPGAFILFSQISHTDAAVHTAGGNE